MTPERLRMLIDDGESLSVEFKGETVAEFTDDDLVKTVVCLANRSNTDVGWLLIGVEDDGRVSGARHRHAGDRTDLVRVQALIGNRTRPSLSARVEMVLLDGREVLTIEVPAAFQPIGTSDGYYLRRIIGGDGKPCCVPFHFHEMQSRQADLGLLDYSALQLGGVGFDMLEPLEFDRYRRTIRENRHRGDESLLALDNLELAKALGAVEQVNGEVNVRVLGLLLFGREEVLASKLPTHEAAFQLISNIDVEVNDFFHWPLLHIMEELDARFRARNREKEFLFGMTRIGVPDYSDRAFREGVANALTHRDYTRQGAVHVQWRQDRLEISNPGGFPSGVHCGNLLVTQPRPRNQLLADAFKRAGIVERIARGIDTIFSEQIRMGHPAPSYEKSTETDVVLELPGGDANLGFVRLVVEQGRLGLPLSQDELLLLSSLGRHGRLTVSQAATTIQKENGDAETSLRRLCVRGIVDVWDTSRDQFFRLSGIATLRLRDRMDVHRGHVRRIPYEEVVRRYVAEHGSISRSVVAALCSISFPQAYRLLRNMVSDGVLRRVGAGRTARYERNV